MLVLVILAIVIAIAAVTFALQNSTIVAISFGVWQFQESLAIILLITFGLGIIVSLLISIPTIIKRGWQSSRQKKKILNLDAEIKSRDTAIIDREKINQTSEQKTVELLQAFELNDSATSLLKEDSVNKLISYLLQQINNQSGNPRYNSLSVFLFAVEPAKSNQNLTLEKQENAIYRAIANRLKAANNFDSFLGITNQKQFICLCLGSIKPNPTEYSHYLIDILTESPLQKADGTTMSLKVWVGGAIANSGDISDSSSLFRQAQQNLEKAQEKRRNSIVISEVTTVV